MWFGDIYKYIEDLPRAFQFMTDVKVTMYVFIRDSEYRHIQDWSIWMAQELAKRPSIKKIQLHIQADTHVRRLESISKSMRFFTNLHYMFQGTWKMLDNVDLKTSVSVSRSLRAQLFRTHLRNAAWADSISYRGSGFLEGLQHLHEGLERMPEDVMQRSDSGWKDGYRLAWKPMAEWERVMRFWQ